MDQGKTSFDLLIGPVLVLIGSKESKIQDSVAATFRLR